MSCNAKSSVGQNQLNEVSDGNYAKRWQHHEVGVLIRRTKDYVVHISAKNNRLDWETSGDFDKKLPKPNCPEFEHSKHQDILAEVAIAESRPSSGLEPDTIRDYRTLLGEALVSAFERDYETAHKLVAEAKSYFEARCQEKSRYWYLIASLCAAAPCAAGIFILIASEACFVAFFGKGAFWVTLAGLAGAMGALFSVLLRIGSLQFDCAAGCRLHFLEGGSRILAGFISGGFVALAFFSGLFFPALGQAEAANFILIVLAAMSGIGERFAISLLSKFQEDSATKA